MYISRHNQTFPGRKNNARSVAKNEGRRRQQSKNAYIHVIIYLGPRMPRKNGMDAEVENWTNVRAPLLSPRWLTLLEGVTHVRDLLIYHAYKKEILLLDKYTSHTICVWYAHTILNAKYFCNRSQFGQRESLIFYSTRLLNRKWVHIYLHIQRYQNCEIRNIKKNVLNKKF